MQASMIARELLATAKEVLSMEFPTKDALNKYLKEHPDADRSNHKVVPGREKRVQKHVERQRTQKIESWSQKYPKVKDLDDEGKQDLHKLGHAAWAVKHYEKHGELWPEEADRYKKNIAENKKERDDLVKKFKDKGHDWISDFVKDEESR